MASFASKTIAVIGATGGVGSSLSRVLAARGARVLLVGRDKDGLQSLRAELGEQHMISHLEDASDPARVKAALADHPSDLYGLAYAVGNITLKSLQRATPEDFSKDFMLHVVGAATAVQATQRTMAKNKAGSVVMFSSVCVQQGFAQHAVVGAAKGAVEGLTRSLAAELAASGIRVNAVAPSLTHSKMGAKMCDGKMGEALAKMHPLGRLGQPEDVAGAATYLLDPASSWVTGQILGVDGGRSAVA